MALPAVWPRLFVLVFQGGFDERFATTALAALLLTAWRERARPRRACQSPRPLSKRPLATATRLQQRLPTPAQADRMGTINLMCGG